MTQLEHRPSSNREQFQAALDQVQHKLEVNDENENLLERSANRDTLLEQQDALLETLSSLASPLDSLSSANSTT